MSRTARNILIVAVGIALAVVIAIVFDSPTSVWLLLGLVAVGVALAFAGSRKGRT